MLRFSSSYSNIQRCCVSVIGVGALTFTPLVVLANTSSTSSVLIDRTNSIEVFTTAGDPVSHVPEGVAVIELDAPARLDAEISQGLSADLNTARSRMRERIQSPEWQSVMQRYGDLHTGVARAWLLRVEKLPAVVVDGQYVIYGQHNVESAVQEIVTFMAREAE
ncbi:MAG: TIGR03757 family integrating conjugative element protein [Halomonas sp.]|nr:TIGR03757 family integrating conjugative element protein [Halomonas sp.]MCC5902714.1 TIGR03757 family integrating conjugative element protein [Halomonas sp.]